MRRFGLAAALVTLATAFIAEGGDDKSAPAQAKTTAAAVRDAFKRAADLQKSGATNKACDAAINDFLDAFMASDWSAFDVATERVLVNRGLYLGAERFVDKDPANAARAYEKFIELFPDDSVTPYARSSLGPAWVASGDVTKGLDRLERAVAAANPRAASSANVALGDWRSAVGDLEGAGKAWKAALAAVDQDPRAGLAEQHRKIPETRMALAGQPLPALGTLKRAGGDTKQEAIPKGRIVVVELWETPIGPCRALNELAGRYTGGDVTFVGLTRFNSEGPFGHTSSQGPSEEVNLTAGNIEAFVRQVAAEQKHVHPMFVATDEAFEKLGGHGVVIVDQTSRVALRTDVGEKPGDTLIVKVTLDRLRASSK